MFFLNRFDLKKAFDVCRKSKGNSDNNLQQLRTLSDSKFKEKEKEIFAVQ